MLFVLFEFSPHQHLESTKELCLESLLDLNLN